MGVGGISIWQLVIVLAIVILLFGTKKMRNIGGDLGSAIMNFKSSMSDGEQGKDGDTPDQLEQKQADTAEDTKVSAHSEAKPAEPTKPS